MGLKFRRGTTAQKSGSLAFGEPYVNTDLGTLQIGGATGDITLGASGTGSAGQFSSISGSSLEISGNASIGGNLTLGGNITIGDNTSDTVNMTAALSSSLIPSVTNAFDLGSPTKVWRDLYISTGSIKLVNPATGQVVSVITADANGQTNFDTLIKANLGIFIPNSVQTSGAGGLGIGAYGDRLMLGTSGSAGAGQQSLIFANTGASNQYTFPNGTGTIAFTSDLTSGAASVTALNSFTSSFNSISGTFARTNSANTFNGDQTISGSLFVTSDLIVGGSSSIQNISSSNLVIGASYVTLNTFSPSSRFAGLQIIDSGSSPIGSGSFLYDAVQDEFIMVHKGNGTNVTSSHFVLGPETYDNLGNEIYLTTNKLPKGTGKEHLVDSNITDDGTTISLGLNTIITGSLSVGTLNATNGIVSGTLQVISILSSLNTYTGSNDTTNATQNTSLTNLNSATASLATRLNAVETATSSYETKGRGIFSGSAQVTGLTNTNLNGTAGITNANLANSTITIAGTSTALGGTIAASTIGNAIGAFSGSSQVTLSSTTGYGSVLNQAVLTTSTPTFASLTINGAITATGDITAYFSSDKRFKSNIQLIPNALEKVNKLNGVTWTWNEDVNEVTKTTPNTGLIAQEVQEVLPEVVMEREDGHLGLDYSKMMGLLVEAIKEQQTQIHSLTLEVENLKKNNSL